MTKAEYAKQYLDENYDSDYANELVYLWNEYQDKYGSGCTENYIYCSDEDFLNIYFENRLDELFRATCYGNVNYTDEFIKFNALHGYIVDNFADGEDNCQEIVLTKTDIEDILVNLEMVKANHSLAEELLPNHEGFFFGSQEYDEDYFENVYYSIELFKKILSLLAKNNRYEVIYQASW